MNIQWGDTYNFSGNCVIMDMAEDPKAVYGFQEDTALINPEEVGISDDDMRNLMFINDRTEGWNVPLAGDAVAKGQELPLAELQQYSISVGYYWCNAVSCEGLSCYHKRE